MTDNKLAIVIVNWNAGHQLADCVHSILAHGDDLVSKIIVVDNGSVDGSLEKIHGLPGVVVIRTGKNLGFAAACNIGATEADSTYLLFLNPDTRLQERSLSVPLAFMDRAENAGVGICGIQLVDEQGEVSRSCARFPTLGRLSAPAIGLDKLPGLDGIGMHMLEWDHQHSRQVDHVIGAFYLIRKAVFEACEGFDERFFVYLEDLDLSFRAKQAGWDSWYLTEARAFHAGGGTSRQVKAKRLFYSLSSRLLYGFKHFSRWKAGCLVLVTCLIEPFTRTVFCLLKRDWSGIRNTAFAYILLYRALPQIILGKRVGEP
ncbi:glycosyl transferase family protein [Methylophaga lonarensis MPL]|uniref:Glycosyl transferase family protein n=1 Tax=Methylophaga lonarensis MPL TaxID=1286106 RepID=M7NXJ5_9GAMM|nr:glycosyltransferase family 2 protein [Methylophaga lonarensis]EMR11901.1 glycosyl transferase family protein [Methylophaga lonarensis MPL]